MSKQIQIGVIAYRDPATGEFKNSRPLYQPSTPELEEQERFMQDNLARLMAAGLADYIRDRENKGEA